VALCVALCLLIAVGCDRYTRISDCWNRPITGVAGTRVTLVERVSPDYNVTFKLTGERIDMLNLASYNYLGMADNASGPNAEARAAGKSGSSWTRSLFPVLLLAQRRIPPLCLDDCFAWQLC
jgi:hypothetical protein